MSILLSWERVWIGLCLLPAVAINARTTRVSFFDRCGELISVGRGEHYVLDVSGSHFTRGIPMCRLALKGVAGPDDNNPGLLHCQLTGNSTIGAGVNIIIDTHGPDSQRIYNSSHWISPKETFNPARRLVFTTIRSGSGRVAPLHITFTVSETVSPDVPWSLSYSLGCVVLFCVVITAVGMGFKFCSQNNKNILCNFFRFVSQSFAKCNGKEDPAQTDVPPVDVDDSRNSTSPGGRSGLDVLPENGNGVSHLTPTVTNMADNPPSYESCLATCDRNRPATSRSVSIFIPNMDYPRCTCGADSPPSPISEVPEYPPPSYEDSVAQLAQQHVTGTQGNASQELDNDTDVQGSSAGDECCDTEVQCNPTRGACCETEEQCSVAEEQDNALNAHCNATEEPRVAIEAQYNASDDLCNATQEHCKATEET